MKKLPSQLSTNELIEVLNTEEASGDPLLDKPSEHSVLQFLADYGVYNGKNPVYSATLYKLYVRSVEHHRRVSPNEFHLLVKGYLEHSIVGKDRIVYHCNKKISDLTKILADFLQKKHYNKKIKSRHYRKHFEMFLNNNNIKAGTRPVPATVLYYFYDKWKFYKNKEAKTYLGYLVFCSIFRLYMKAYCTAKYSLVFKISDEFFNNITDDEYNTALEWAKKFNESKKKE